MEFSSRVSIVPDRQMTKVSRGGPVQQAKVREWCRHHHIVEFPDDTVQATDQCRLMCKSIEELAVFREPQDDILDLTGSDDPPLRAATIDVFVLDRHRPLFDAVQYVPLDDQFTVLDRVVRLYHRDHATVNAPCEIVTLSYVTDSCDPKTMLIKWCASLTLSTVLPFLELCPIKCLEHYRGHVTPGGGTASSSGSDDAKDDDSTSSTVLPGRAAPSNPKVCDRRLWF